MIKVIGLSGNQLIGKILNFKFHFLLFIFSFLILTRFNIDPDLGWHLAMGRYFWQTGEILKTDSFSWTMPGYSWGHSYFGYQILTAFLFENFGHIATAMIFGLLASLGVLILTGANLNFFKLLLIFLGLGVSISNLGVRPHTISFLLFAICLNLVETRRLSTKIDYIVLFVIFALWANFHRGFVVALIILGTLLFLKSIRNKKGLFNTSQLKKLAIFILVSLAASFATPFIFSSWKSGIIGDFLSRENLITIAEWQSIALFFPLNLLYALTGIVFLVVLLKKFNFVERELVLAAAFTFIFGFLFSGLVFIWVAFFIYIVSRYLNFTIKKNFKFDLLVKFYFVFIVLAVILAVLLNSFIYTIESADLRKRLILDKYPVEAVAFIRREKLLTNIYNQYEWGGFLDWYLPDAKVFIDGRMASWRKQDGTSILGDYVAIYNGECNIAQKYDIKTILVKRTKDLSCFGNWEVAYQDEIAKVLIKK